MLEIIFKIILTIPIIILIVWLWSQQIDVKQTFLGLFKHKVVKQAEWIATRNINNIYQEGIVVGVISGAVEKVEDKILFREICNTSQLNQNLPIEYGRQKLKIIKIDTIIGMFCDGRTVKNSVMGDVFCEEVKN